MYQGLPTTTTHLDTQRIQEQSRFIGFDSFAAIVKLLLHLATEKAHGTLNLDQCVEKGYVTMMAVACRLLLQTYILCRLKRRILVCQGQERS